MENKYTRRLLSNFPNNFGFVNKKNDPLHIIADAGASYLDVIELDKFRKADNLFIDTCDPALVSSVYYIDMNVDNMDNVNITPLTNGGTKIVEMENDFIANDITGFDFVEQIFPSGVFPSGILGLSYGFDWDEPLVYLTTPDSSYVYAYSEFDELPTLLDYSYAIQSFETAGFDEYINFEIEDGVKVAYLEHDVVSDLRIVDVGNLKDPKNPESDGIEVLSDDYTVVGNKITFESQRSDYVPAVLSEIGDGQVYTYPPDYQPDENFDSVFIVEYKYKLEDDPRYLKQATKLHNLGKKENPLASY